MAFFSLTFPVQTITTPGTAVTLPTPSAFTFSLHPAQMKYNRELSSNTCASSSPPSPALVHLRGLRF